jgi:hypothetical protein
MDNLDHGMALFEALSVPHPSQWLLPRGEVQIQFSAALAILQHARSSISWSPREWHNAREALAACLNSAYSRGLTDGLKQKEGETDNG